jgi:hypothetical protein
MSNTASPSSKGATTGYAPKFKRHAFLRTDRLYHREKPSRSSGASKHPTSDWLACMAKLSRTQVQKAEQPSTGMTAIVLQKGLGLLSTKHNVWKRHSALLPTVVTPPCSAPAETAAVSNSASTQVNSHSYPTPSTACYSANVGPTPTEIVRV